jgi:histidine phosphotransferase ChpT
MEAVERFSLAILEHLTARLCHELVSPIGAISNGIEILEDEPDYAQDAGRLIDQSAREAARRLQFYRVAYGSTGDVTDERARTVTLDFFAGGKIECDWPDGLPPLPAGGQKLVCNLMLMASEALPRGGLVRLIAEEGPGGMILAALAAGEAVRLVEPAPALLGGALRIDDLTPRTVQAAYTAALARRWGGKIVLSQAKPDEMLLIVRSAG